MKKQSIIFVTACMMTFMSACSEPNAGNAKQAAESATPTTNQEAKETNTTNISEEASIEEPIFANASVHDPSIIKVEDTFYIFGSL